MSRWVVMFAKAPVPGKVKTRLAQHIGFEMAASFHEAFIADQFAVLRTLQQHDVSLTLALAVSGDQHHEAFDALRQAGVVILEQGDGDLGARLVRIGAQCFEQGCTSLVIVGSDSPSILPRLYHQAFEQLSKPEHRVVYGPSFDGGYYLVGMNRWTPELFEQIPWSQPNTLAVSLSRAEDVAGCLCVLLEFWYDVDTLIDLQFLQTHLHQLHRQAIEVCPRTDALLKRWNGEVV